MVANYRPSADLGILEYVVQGLHLVISARQMLQLAQGCYSAQEKAYSFLEQHVHVIFFPRRARYGGCALLLLDKFADNGEGAKR